MTFKEKLAIEHPDKIDPTISGGCKGCPSDYGYCNAEFENKICEKSLSLETCDECWNTEISNDIIDVEFSEINDIVNHPNHYTNGGMECIDEMILVFGKDIVANFCLCNVWKYRYRATSKNGEEDIKKSHWYMNKYKELMSNG